MSSTSAPLMSGDDEAAEDGKSSFGAAPPQPVPDATIDRDLMVSVMERRAYRLKQCRSVPASLAAYFIYIILIVLHASVPAAYEVEASLYETLVQGGTGFALTSTLEWYTWLTGSLIPSVLFTAANPNDDTAGYVSNYNLMIGGIRLVTTRGKNITCDSLSPALSSLYSLPCYSKSAGLSGYSSAPYGNQTLLNPADWARVASAFVSSETEGGAPAFVYYLPTTQRQAAAINQVGFLQAGGWLDPASRAAAVQLALLNGQSGVFASVDLHATFTAGSLVELSAEVRSVPVDPYSPVSARGYLYALDALLVAYWLYLLFGAARRAWLVLRAGGGALERTASLCSYWRLLDAATVAALAAVIILWALMCAELAALRGDIASVVATTPASIQNGPSSLQANLFSVVDRLAQVKEAAVMTLIFLTLRLFKYFAFQPRLAIMSTVFARACGDMCTHGFVFLLLVVMFGVWGHFLFGPQAVDWSTPGSSAFAIFRFSMYDYKFIPMQQQYPFLAMVFYVTFMILITNLVLWMFLAILFETYTEVRYESHNTPSAFEEGAAFLSTVPRDASACWSRRCGGGGGLCARLRCCGRCGGGDAPKRRGAPLTLLDVTASVSWADIALALHTDPELSRASIVTPQALARALGISRDAANLLIADADAVSEFVLSLPVPDGVDGAGRFSRESAAQLAAEAQMSARANALYGAVDSLGAPGLKQLTGVAAAAAGGGANPAAAPPPPAAAARLPGNRALSRALTSRMQSLSAVPPMVGGLGRMLSRAASVRFREAAAMASSLQDAQDALAEATAQAATLDEITGALSDLRTQMDALLRERGVAGVTE